MDDTQKMTLDALSAVIMAAEIQQEQLEEGDAAAQCQAAELEVALKEARLFLVKMRFLSGDENVYDVLFDHYVDQMPYGVAKARDMDPFMWISARIENELHSEKP